MPRRPKLSLWSLAALASSVLPAPGADFHDIAGVTTTSTNDLWPVSNLVQGPGAGYSATEPHAQLGGGSSHRWVTAAPDGFPSDYIEQTGKPVLTFDLGAERALGEISVWGYTATNNNGVSEFSLKFATELEGAGNAGASIAYNPSFQPTNNDADRQSFVFSQLVVARYVEFTCEDNFYVPGGAGGGDRVGLGEVAFEDTVPNPNPILDLAASLDFGNPAEYSGPVELPLAVRNLGVDRALQITGVALGGDGAFAVGATPPAIAAGQSRDLSITFDPAGNDGCYEAQLLLSTNDPARPTATVVLVGGLNCVQPEPEKPLFSLEGGTFVTPFSLVLSTPTPGAQIIYTTDGTLPSLGNGALYGSPIAIDRSVQVRAATVSGAHPPAVATESYIRLAPDLAGYRSEIPILVIDNFGAGGIPNKGWSTSTQTGGGLIQPERQPAYMGIFDTDPADGRASIASGPDTDSRIGIRVRGAFSSTWNPKPYSLETWKQTGDVDRDVSPLGMPSDSDWILYFPHPNYDRTMLNNTFTWELASQCDRYGTRFRWVDVFVNEDGGDLQLSDRKGVYALAEKVKRGAGRIDFEPLADDGSTGGWLLAINRMDPQPIAGYPTENGATSPQFFHTPGPNRIAQTPANTSGQGDDIPRQYNAFINFENPNGYRISATQRSTIENWFVEFENVFYDDEAWLDPTSGYRRYVDTRDVITYFQLLNLGKQGDGLLLSMFPWVSSGERKLHMGPMWDFNNGAYGGSTNSPLYFRQDRLWYPRFFDDPSFLREYIDRWFELRRGPLSDANMHAIIDRQAAGIPDALVGAQGVTLGTWRGRISDMKNWVANRAGWIDSRYLPPPDFAHPGGVVSDGFSLEIQNNTGQPGTVFYTLDGSDPMGADDVTVVESVLLDQGSPATGSVPSVENGGAALEVADWAAVDPPPNDDAWIAGTNGAGYDYEGLVGLDLEASMRGTNGSAYLRIPFQLDAPTLAAIDRLTLRMKYDDGFVAYVNGNEVASENAPPVVAWDSLATGNHADNDARQFQDTDISGHLGALVPGQNVLAVHLLNVSPGSSDALALPQLVAADVTVGTPGSIAYTGPVALDSSARVRARVLTEGGEWSAINEATYITGTLAGATNLVVSEIMYHPADGSGEEFVELLNISPDERIDLSGATFTDGIEYTFPVGSSLAPGERVVIAQSEFENGTRLANGGERIALSGAGGGAIFDFAYDDDAPWPELPDGDGPSLVLIDPASNPDPADPLNWRPSSSAGGNPGTTDTIRFDGSQEALSGYALGPVPPRVVADGEVPRFEFDQKLAAEDAIVTVQTSPDLVDWQDLPAVAELTFNDDGTVTRSVPLNAGIRFARLAIRLR